MQSVRAQILAPPVPAGTSNCHIWPGLSRVPPRTGYAAGHTGKGHWLVTWTLAAPAAAAATATRRTAKRTRGVVVAGNAIGAACRATACRLADGGVYVYIEENEGRERLQRCPLCFQW
ncbi:hypothetical protein EJB05_00183, partial [Eragrostis curvula]